MSLECSSTKLSFSAFLDKQLKATDQAALEEHLCDCSDCSCAFADHKEFGAILSAYMLRTQSMLPDLWQTLEGKLPSTCNLIENEFSAFLDGELTSAAQEGVRDHLKTCPECLKRFRTMNTINRAIVKRLEVDTDSVVDVWPAIKAQLNANCNLIETELSAFIDQQMPMQRHRDITVHILECPRCSETIRRFSSVGEVITHKYAPQVPLELNLMSGVSDKLRVVQLNAKERPRRLRNIYLAASAVVLAVVVPTVLLLWRIFGVSEAEPVSCEAYLMSSTFDQPSPIAEVLLYEQ